MHMKNLTVHVRMVYNDRRCGYQKYLISTVVFRVIQESLELVLKIARLFVVTWLLDLSDPYYPHKLRLIRSHRSAGYVGSFGLLRSISLPCDRNFDYVEAIYLYLYLFKITSQNSPNLINKGA